MKMVAAMPAWCAAQATAWPWFPALAVTTPAARSTAESVAIVLTAPRILNAPVRCRFSAFRKTGRPQRRAGVSGEDRGVLRAIRSGRSRGGRMSASVGRSMVHPEDLPENLLDRRQRVELALLHGREQPAELRLLGD